MHEINTPIFTDIISVENLLAAWQEFRCGKSKRADVLEFEADLMSHIMALHYDLAQKRYRHSPYEDFYISDPKRRHIHKALVRDCLLHHAIYRILYPYFDTKFIYDSYSCRDTKGTHRALNRFRSFGYQVSRNHTRTCWVLKCDIRKFFASIDQEILMDILRKHIADTDVLWLLERVVGSFETPARFSTENARHEPRVSLEMTHWKIGLPLGNLTSQLLVNIYMNEFDQWVKHRLKVKHYIRYADDFVFLSGSKQYLQDILPLIREFLWETLRLKLHPDKVYIQALASGVDFLGWVHFSDYRTLRTSTKKRALRNCIEKETKDPTVQSYLGLMRHGNAQKLQNKVLNL